MARLTLLMCWRNLTALTTVAMAVGFLPVALAGTGPLNEILSPALLEARRALIGEIYIDNRNIFDLDNPQENKALFRLGNNLHLRTRPKIIRRQLLFKPGELYSQRKIDETERILRSNDYLESAQIVPLRYADGKVDIEVSTVDVWTLHPRFSFGRSGGKSRSKLGLQESNLLGTGIDLSVIRESNVDRDATTLQVSDRQLGSTWYSLATAYANNSDGHAFEFNYGKPFYALDARRSNGLELSSKDRIDKLYDQGEVQAEFRHKSDQANIFAGISDGLRDGWVRRLTAGVRYNEHRFMPGGDLSLTRSVLPDDRKFVVPYLGFELLEDRYEETQNFDQIARVEDRFLGTRLALQIGYASTTLGSLDNALLIDASAVQGFGSASKNSLFTSADLSMRWQEGRAENLLLTLDAAYYRRQSDHRLLFASLGGNFGQNLDLDQPLLLGGDNGLRGYPLRYQGGDSSALFTIEERFFTDWYPFRLFRVGGAVFFDAGRTWGNNPVADENLGWLRDVGFGLRLGNTRTAKGKVIHVDVAFPLDGDESISGVQILIEGKSTF